MSKPNRVAELDDSAMRLLAIEEDRIGHRLGAEEDVLGHAQDGDQHEVLVDHADAPGDGIRRALDHDGRPVQEDLAAIGRRQPVEDVHEGRLARAVLAEERVDLARPDLQVDPVVRDDARVGLRDPAHLERGGGHGLGHGLGHGGLGRIAVS